MHTTMWLASAPEVTHTQMQTALQASSHSLALTLMIRENGSYGSSEDLPTLLLQPVWLQGGQESDLITESPPPISLSAEALLSTPLFWPEMSTIFLSFSACLLACLYSWFACLFVCHTDRHFITLR